MTILQVNANPPSVEDVHTQRIKTMWDWVIGWPPEFSSIWMIPEVLWQEKLPSEYWIRNIDSDRNHHPGISVLPKEYCGLHAFVNMLYGTSSKPKGKIESQYFVTTLKKETYFGGFCPIKITKEKWFDERKKPNNFYNMKTQLDFNECETLKLFLKEKFVVQYKGSY